MIKQVINFIQRVGMTFILLFLTLHCSAQINRHIWGITLGKSTKQEVCKYLDSKNLWHREYQNGYVTQMYSNIEFISIPWSVVNYYFTNNKVYVIEFRLRDEDNVKATLNYYNKIKRMLMSKYTKSKKFIPEAHKDELKYVLKDSNTLIELKARKYNHRVIDRELIFRYTDIRSSKAKAKADINNI